MAAHSSTGIVSLSTNRIPQKLQRHHDIRKHDRCKSPHISITTLSFQQLHAARLQVMSTKHSNFPENFVSVEVMMRNVDLVSTSHKSNHFTIKNYTRLSEQLKTSYEETLPPYPKYVTQTERYTVVPFGREPKIDSNLITNTKLPAIEEEEEEKKVVQEIGKVIDLTQHDDDDDDDYCGGDDDDEDLIIY